VVYFMVRCVYGVLLPVYVAGRVSWCAAAFAVV